MKKCLMLAAVLGCLLLTEKSSAQGAGDIPPFKLLRTNGQFFTASNLPQNKPVLLIYFAPDCGHCLDLLNPFFRQINKFRQTAVVLATFKPVNDLSLFERTYKTSAYPNLVLGTEGTTFFLRNHFNMQKTPFVALFDRKGKLVHTFRNEPTVEELIAGVNQLR